ncbi:MAG: secretin N-terminal domain-containing protein [Candidatus Auribacterota bacterium]
MKNILKLSALSAFLVMGFGILWVAAQPVPPGEDPSRMERGFEYMRQSRDKVMTGDQTKDLLQDKSKDASSQKISLELRNINIVDVLKILSQTGGINIVAGPSVRGNTTIFLEDVNVWDALRIILEINQLAYVQDGEILKVLSEKEYQDKYGVPFHDTAQTQVFRLKHATVEDVNRALTSIKSSVGKIIIDERTNTLIVIDTPDAMVSLKKVVEELDVKVETRVFQLTYTTPDVIEKVAKDVITKKGIIQVDELTNKIIVTDTVEALDFLEGIIKEYDMRPRTITKTYYLRFASYEDVETKVKDLLTKDVGVVISDKRTNALVITDYPEKIEDLLPVIESLDKVHRQVLIDCKIIAVVMNDNYAMGIDFERIYENMKNYTMGVEEQFGATTGEGQAFPIPVRPTTDVGFAGTGSGTGTIITLGKPNEMNAVIRILKSMGKTKLLSEPRITVMNNEEAQIQVGTDEPFVTSSNTVNASTNTVAEDIQFIDVGVLLSVTPTINDEDYVTMKIKPEVSQVQRTVLTSQSNEIPVVQTSELETTVMVKNLETIVLGGLIRETRVKDEARVPIIGAIPILGMPFRSTSTRIDQEELVVFITPEIISGEETMYKSPYSRSFSREFLYQLNELEKINELKYKDYLQDKTAENMGNHMKKNNKETDLNEMKKSVNDPANLPEEEKKKLFFGIF